MAFFENLGATISSKGKDVAKKAKELAEVASLNGQISTQEDNINRIYTEMGKALFESCKVNPDVRWEDKCAQVEAAYAEIERLRREILQVKGVKQCPKCGIEVSKEAAFCPGCGAKMPEDSPEEAEQTAGPAEEVKNPGNEVFETVENPQVVQTVDTGDVTAEAGGQGTDKTAADSAGETDNTAAD